MSVISDDHIGDGRCGWVYNRSLFAFCSCELINSAKPLEEILHIERCDY